MFSRYNITALGLFVASLLLEITSKASLTECLVMLALALTLALKIAFDVVIRRREGAGQIRGIGEDGKRLNLLHQIVERETLAVVALSFSSFVLNLLPASKW